MLPQRCMHSHLPYRALMPPASLPPHPLPCPPSQMVFSSSCTVYGIPDKVPLSEDAPIKAVSPYGRTKEFQEYMFRWGQRQHKGLHAGAGSGRRCWNTAYTCSASQRVALR
jgi:hypothetical protein